MKNIFICSFFSCACFFAQGQAGYLDSSFGNNGKVISDFGSDERAYASVLQADGKIVVGGTYDEYPDNNARLLSCAIARYNANGTLDSAFGVNGFVHNKIGNSFSGIAAVAVQNDGKIVAAGYANLSGYYNQLIVVRYTKSGIIDSSFGTGGIAYYAAGTGKSAEGNAMAIQPNGKIVVAGSVTSSLVNTMLVVRFKSNGERDSSFGINGKTIISPRAYSGANAIALVPGGKMIIVGFGSSLDSFTTHFAAARLTGSGILDTSFGNRGSVITKIGQYSNANAIALIKSGKIIVTGYTRSDRYENFALVRYNINGRLDSTFGSQGITVTSFSNTGRAAGVVVRQDEKIVAAGFADKVNLLKSDFALARYTSDGDIDTSFGTEGKIRTVFGSAESSATAALLQPDGKIIATGFTQIQGTNQNFALARYTAGEQSLSEKYNVPIAKMKLVSKHELIVKLMPRIHL